MSDLEQSEAALRRKDTIRNLLNMGVTLEELGTVIDIPVSEVLNILSPRR